MRKVLPFISLISFLSTYVTLRSLSFSQTYKSHSIYQIKALDVTLFLHHLPPIPCNLELEPMARDLGNDSQTIIVG